MCWKTKHWFLSLICFEYLGSLKCIKFIWWANRLFGLNWSRFHVLGHWIGIVIFWYLFECVLGSTLNLDWLQHLRENEFILFDLLAFQIYIGFYCTVFLYVLSESVFRVDLCHVLSICFIFNIFIIFVELRHLNDFRTFLSLIFLERVISVMSWLLEESLHLKILLSCNIP